MRGAYANRIAADILREELQMDGTKPSSLSDIFEREPPDLTTFITDKNYLGNPRLGPIQFDFVHHLEQIYLPETYIAMVEEFGPQWVPTQMVHMLVAQWGKGAGKDMVCRLGVTRATDLLMCLKNPQTYFGLPAQDDIHILNVAAAADQARRAFFAPMKKLFTSNKHLQEFFRDGVVPGEKSTSILLEKNIELVSGHSMAETQEGLNLLIGIADEISAFKTKDELQRYGLAAEGRDAKTAESIVKMLRTSARTRFPRNFKVAQISYPRFKGDAIQQSTLIGNNDNKRWGNKSKYYVSGPFATWDVNPRVGDKSYFQDDYEEDPEMAMSMYECQPSAAVNRFMRNDIAIAHAFHRNIPEPITVEYYWGLPEKSLETPHMPAERPGWQVRFYYNEDVLQPMAGAAYALHGDLAITGDRAGIAMSHIRTSVETQPNADNEVFEPRPVIRNDFVFAFEAELKATNPAGDLAPREIQIRWYRQLVWDLISRGFYVASVTFDSFQSEDMIQIFESRGIESSVLSLDRNDKVYQTFKDVVYDNRFEGYFRQKTIDEVSALRVTPNKKVDHVPGGSKDEADALAGSVWGAIAIGGDEGPEPINTNIAEPFQFVGGSGAIAQSANFGLSPRESFGGNSSDMGTLMFGG